MTKTTKWHVRPVKTDQPGHPSSLISVFAVRITKTCLYNFDPLKPHFYIVKLGFTGVYIIFLISAPSSRRFQRVPTIYVLSRKYKISDFFKLKISYFLVIKFSVYFNRHVFVMAYKKLGSLAQRTLIRLGGRQSSLCAHAILLGSSCGGPGIKGIRQVDFQVRQLLEVPVCLPLHEAPLKWSSLNGKNWLPKRAFSFLLE